MKRVIVLFILGFASLSLYGKGDGQLDSLYRKGQREFNRQNYSQAQIFLEKYITESKNKAYKRERLFWVIDQIGRIHLRVKRNPDSAIIFFENIVKDKRLNEAEEDDIQSWITAAKNWKKMGKMPRHVKKADDLFNLGKKYFDKGNAEKEYPNDDSGNAYYAISKTYLIPLIVNYDNYAKLAQALFMMGEMQRHLRTDITYWNDNHYLKETIRRFPHSAIAMRAWNSLRDDIELGFTGSGGNNTPPSIKSMLNKYRVLAQPENKGSRK